MKNESKICEFKYVGSGEYRSGCGKLITVDQIREIDRTNERKCPACGKVIEWPDPMKYSGKKENK